MLTPSAPIVVQKKTWKGRWLDDGFKRSNPFGNPDLSGLGFGQMKP